MRKSRLAAAVLACLMTGLLIVADNGPTFGQPPAQKQPPKAKLDPMVVKKLLKKLDPQILESQRALREAKSRLMVARNKLHDAIEDEVFREAGRTEAAVLDQLRIAHKDTEAAIRQVDAAIRSADLAQRLDVKP